MKVYAFWNNKGGTGKTSLCFQSVCRYAEKYVDKKILVVDVCPQANLSELFLGGLLNDGSNNLLKRQEESSKATVGGYFQLRLPSPFEISNFDPKSFITHVADYNDQIPQSIDLLCGDPLLELQSNAISTLANTQIPGTNTWIEIIDWLRDFIEKISDEYDVVFIDTNPSFSIYTQIALSSSNRLVLPVMADDSSRRAIQNAFSLIYGLKLPSDIYSEHAFATRLKSAKRELPKVHLIVKNRITQYMGPASAYATVLKSIEDEVSELVKSNTDMFTFEGFKENESIVAVRDFQTTGVVAFARGCPFSKMKPGKFTLMGEDVSINKRYIDDCIQAIDLVVDLL